MKNDDQIQFLCCTPPLNYFSRRASSRAWRTRGRYAIRSTANGCGSENPMYMCLKTEIAQAAVEKQKRQKTHKRNMQQRRPTLCGKAAEALLFAAMGTSLKSTFQPSGLAKKTHPKKTNFWQLIMFDFFPGPRHVFHKEV